MKKLSRERLLLGAVVIGAVLAAAMLATIYRAGNAKATLLPDRVMTLLPEPRPLGPFLLTDQRDLPFDLARLQGRWSFVFFGFSFCPDVCPTTLAVLARVQRLLGENGADTQQVQVVFVSVDPHRDTPAQLALYLQHFDPAFVGASGEEGQIANFAAQLGAAYRTEYAPGAADYPVFHTTAVFLVDPQASLHAVFTPPLDAAAIAARFKGVRELATDQPP